MTNINYIKSVAEDHDRIYFNEFLYFQKELQVELLHEPIGQRLTRSTIKFFRQIIFSEIIFKSDEITYDETFEFKNRYTK